MINTAFPVEYQPQLKKAYLNQKKLFPEFGDQKPFLKWAGGKSQMANDIKKFVPPSFNKYIEPFIGGGAIYFSLNHSKSIISDLNEELIITYKQVKENVFELIQILEGYKNTEDFYYKTRALDTSRLSNLERAARLIYLNKTCFNGLFRVNKKGDFNVPFGKKNGPFLNKETLLSASIYLQQTEIYHSDYKDVLQNHAQEGDFIFLDPPYQPVGKYSDFKRYTKEFFYEKDQIELACVFKDLVAKGCFVILTNSEHPLILELYKDFQLEIIQTKRLISSNPNTRTGVDLMVIGGL
ncbi:DNA adenine methylase [Mucilaginibacter ginsenosidivorans]|uniref:DNA adenine methylase n=1 Tax=Mucilaginibacter ginsenosidivorans TaxID=398053 RepID=UPI001E329541|nr:Dam family site-specific DNA-(adenine-N6)-methyltransferase [Mucilaginibacter ginsenosidivorans]